MNNYKYFLPILLGFSLLVSGCGGGSSAPSAPANAVVITSENAVTVASMAIGFTDTASTLTGVEANMPSAKTAIDTIVGLTFDKNRQIPTTVAGITTSINCTTSGSTDFTESATASGSTGTVTFNSCNESGFIMDGSFSFTSVWDGATGYYLNSGDGNITISFGGQSFTMALVYSEEGNSGNGAFNTNVSFSIASASFGGFLLETTQNLTGNYGIVTAGQIVITGGSATRL